jgi:hypothetical protein
LKCLKLEFQYDINQIDEWLREIDKVLRQVTAMDTMVYSYLKLSNFQTYFLQMAFQTGFLYELINNEDMKNLNNIIYQCSLTNENYVMNNINLWKNQKIAQKEILSMLEYQKDQLHKCKTDLNNIFNKMGP